MTWLRSRGSRSPKYAEFIIDHIVVLQRKAKKYTKMYNAGAELFYCSFLLFSDVLVAGVVIIL